MSNRDLLFEIGTEELPSNVVDLWTGRRAAAGEGFPAKVERELRTEQRLDFDSIYMTATPRRLTLILRGVAEKQTSLTREVRGPAASAAFDESGSPTKAAEGFARSQGTTVDALERRATEQGEYLYAVILDQGAGAADVLTGYLSTLVRSIPFPKSMRWGAGELRFSRPVRWLLSLFGPDPLSLKIDGMISGNITFGHRFLAPGPYEITGVDSYLSTLKEAKVIVDQQEREEACRNQVLAIAAGNGLRAVVHQKVLDEVTNLVEWPTAGEGSFDPDFLALPREVLITSMESHQRYFPLEDENGGLAASFAVIHNGDAAATATIVNGHQRVLSARLSDALFFYCEDKQVPLESLVPRLDGVTYHRKLGTLLSKVERLGSIIEQLSEQLKVEPEVRKRALSAARICKADLLTNMVTEFPVLQGIMGREYVLHEGSAPEVATAIYEHYLPRSRSESQLPSIAEGTMLSFADKLDSVVAFLAVGISPSGSQDPYALRRQAAGIVRLIIGSSMKVNMSALVDTVFAALKSKNIAIPEAADGSPKHRSDVAELIYEQLRRQLLADGLRFDAIDAAISPVLAQADPLDSDLMSVEAKARAIAGLLESEALSDALVIFTRCRNIASAAESDVVNDALLADESEKELAAAIGQLDETYAPAMEAQDYERAIQAFAGLRPAVDKFFDEVLVMAPEQELRQNRQAMLARLVNEGLRLADFGKIVQE